jgi:hypothetical protein
MYNLNDARGFFMLCAVCDHLDETHSYAPVATGRNVQRRVAVFLGSVSEVAPSFAKRLLPVHCRFKSL